MNRSQEVYNRRWIIGLCGGLLLLTMATSLWSFTFQEELPEQLAAHWNGRGEVDGYDSLLGHVLTMSVVSFFIPSAIGYAAIISRAHSLLLARIGVALAALCGVAINGLSLAIIVGQIGLSSAQNAELHPPTLALSLALAVLSAIGVFLAYRPEEETHFQPSDAINADFVANDASGTIAVQQAARAERGEQSQIKLSVPGARWLVVAVAMLLLLLGWYIDEFVLIFGAVLGGWIYWFGLGGVFLIDEQGTRLQVAKSFKLMKLQYADIKAVHVRQLRAWEYGGVGYRSQISTKGFVTGHGPALVIDMGYHQQQVISMPDLETAGQIGALINAYRKLETAKAATSQ